MAEDIGGISVSVGADVSSLEGQLNQAIQIASDAGDRLGAAFAGGANQGVQQLTTQLDGLGGVLKGLQVLGISSAIEQIGSASLEAYGDLQKATIALTALTGSATQASNEIAGLRTLAQDEALSFPELLNANQRFTALGTAAAQIPGALRAAADAAAAMNTNLTTTSNAMERIASSGTLSSRVLVQLGISMNDVAAAMGVSVDNVKKDFASLTSESDRLGILVDAMGKLQGTAAAVADGISKSFVRIQNAINTALQNTGASIAPAAKDMADLAQVIIPEVGNAISSLAQPAATVVEFGKALVDAKSQIQTLVESLSPFAGVMETVGKDARDSGDTLLSFFSPATATAVDGLKSLTNYIEGYTQASSDADFMTKQISANLDKMSTAARVGGQAFVDAFKGSGAATAAIDQITTAQTKANTEAIAAQTAYDRLSQAYKNNTVLANGQAVSAGDVARALAELKSKQDELNNLNPVYAETLAGITQAYNKQQAEIATLEQTEAGLLSIQSRTADQENMLIEVTNKLATARNAEAQAHLAVKAAIDNLPKAYDGLITSAGDFLKKEQDVTAAVGYSKAVLDSLMATNDGSAEHQRAVTDALNQYIDKLKAGGAAMTDQITLTVNGVQVITTLGNAIQTVKTGQGDWNSVVVNGVSVVRDHAAAVDSATSAVQRHTSAQSEMGTVFQGVSGSIMTATNQFNNFSVVLQHTNDVENGTVDNTDAAAASVSQLGADANGNVDNMSRFANSLTDVASAAGSMSGALDNADRSMKAFVSGADEKLGIHGRHRAVYVVDRRAVDRCHGLRRKRS